MNFLFKFVTPFTEINRFTTMSLPKVIGQNIKSFRTKLGYTQDDIAAVLGVDRSTVSLYEQGQREIGLVQLNKVSDLFGVELETLANAESADTDVSLAFAFRAESMEAGDLNSIADFKKIVKYYLKMVKIQNRA